MTRNIAPLLTSWEQRHITPAYVFDPLKRAFRIQLDPCTNSDNPLGTEYFITETMNGLKAIWQYNAFVNPPYRETKAWVMKGIDEHKARGITVVFLLANRTETEAAQLYAFPQSKAVCFVRRRISFLHPETRKPQGSPTFGSMIVVLKKKQLVKKELEILHSQGYVFLNKK